MSSEPKVLIASMGSQEGVVSWWEGHSDSDLSTLLGSCDNSQTARVFSALAARVESVSTALGGGGEDVEGEENAPPPGPPSTTTHKAALPHPTAQATLKCATTLCLAYLDKVEAVGGKGASATRTPTASDRAVLATLGALHTSLLVLPRDGSKEWVGVVAGVQRACERAWATSLPGAVACTPLVVMMLLSELQDPAGVSPTALRRLYALRGALGEVDFEAPDSASLLELTLRCFVNPGVLKNDMGRKLLAHVMGLSDAMALKAHAAMRSLFPLPTTKWAEWVGDVYIRAWSLAAAAAATSATSASSASTTPFTLETRCLQDLVFRGIHAATPAVFASVRDVASRLVVARNSGGRKDMDALLSRIYAPILWRALDSPNSAIRRNAATLFRDVFPLGEGGGGEGGGEGAEDEEGGSSASASASSSSSTSAPPLAPVALQVQYLTALADDSNGAIRELGVGFLAEALARHWASFPHLARTRLCERLALRCDDAASPGVRVAGLKGLTSVLVGAPASHPTLVSSGALVAAARHIHDRNDRCRGATLGLLATVEVYKGSFPTGVAGLLGEKWSQELMARLVMEEGEGTPSSLRAAEATAKLLLPTLFPPGVTGKAAAKRIAQSLPLYSEGTLALCVWATKIPTLAPPTVMTAAADALFRTAKRLIVTGAEELGVALAAAEAAGEASAAAAAAAAAPAAKAGKGGEGGGEGEEDDTGFDRKRRGRPGAKKKGGKASTASATAAAIGEEDSSSSTAPTATTSSSPSSPTSESLDLTLKFLRATSILLSSGGGASSSSSSTATPATLTLGDIEEMLSALAPLSASDHPLVVSLTESLFALVPRVGGGGGGGGGEGEGLLADSLWERLSGLTPHPSSPTSLPAICPALFTAIAAQDPKGMGGVLNAALRSIEGALPTLQQALATHSVTPAYALLALARVPTAGGEDEDEDGEALPMHPVIAAAALSHILSSTILGTLGVDTPELAVGALFPYIPEEEVRYGFINRAMPALVQGMALLPLALGAMGAAAGGGGGGGGKEEVHHLAGALAEACGSAWCKLTADQVASWVVYQKGGDEGGGGTVATAETNTSDVLGWVAGQLLPPLSSLSTGPPSATLPCVAAGHTLLALITELCGELVGNGMGVAPTLHLFTTLTHPTLLSTSPHLTASPILAPSLLKLAVILVSAASEGITPGSPSILPNSTHTQLLAALARLLAHTSSPTLPASIQGLAFGAAGEIIDRMGKLEGGGVWSKGDMSRVLSSLLSSLLFPRGAGDGGYSTEGGRNIATAFALSCAKWPWACTALVGVIKGALENALGAPLTLASVASLGCEALGVCVNALKKQQQQQGLEGELLRALKALMENAEIMHAFERLDGGSEVLAAIKYTQ